MFNQSRSLVIRFIFLFTILVIIVQLFNLQVISGKYKTLAMENAVFPKIVWPNRGIIYDRNGKAVINNTIMYDLTVVPSSVRNIDTAEFCRLMQMDTSEFRKRITEARIKNGSYRPSVFYDLMPPDLYARMDENSWKFPGFTLVERPVRTYPYHAGAQVLGYIAEVSPREIENSGNFYRPGDYIGKNGLEKSYEKVLMGTRGVQFMIKDNRNRIVGGYEQGKFDTAAIPGRNLHTSLDIELQQLAERLLNNKLGAAVAIDPKTGGILAMASGPTFDPNDLSGPNWQKNLSRMSLDVSGPLFNRGIKGQYPGGSTYKPLGALIGLDEGVISSASGIACSGAYHGCSRPVRCTERFAGHAANLKLAIAWSCNSFFCQAFRQTVDNPRIHNTRLGLQKWSEYAHAFGYGHKLGVDLPSEDGGNIPDTTDYDKEYRGSWNSCTMVTLGIGQDKMTVTPLQIANAICIVANKGYYYVPHFVTDIDGASKEDTTLDRYRKKHEVLTHISNADYETVLDGMQGVTEVGTASHLPKIPGVNICAKTGTAENYKILDRKRVQLKDHSLFVCFAPRENPKIAIAVVIENGGFGSTWAGPIAYLMMEKYLTDSLRPERMKEADRIASSNLMPGYLPRLQFVTDSLRAFDYWFKITNDSSYIKKYLKPQRQASVKSSSDASNQRIAFQSLEAVLPDWRRKILGG